MIAYPQPFLLHVHCHLCVILHRVSSCQTLAGRNGGWECRLLNVLYLDRHIMVRREPA